MKFKEITYFVDQIVTVELC